MAQGIQPEVSSKILLDPVGGTLLLEHAYQVEKRLVMQSLCCDYEATQQPFGRRVRIRLYRSFDELALDEAAEARIREVIARGGDGELAVDVGEIEDGVPFLVLSQPFGVPIVGWWRKATKTPQLLARLALEIASSCEKGTAAQKAEVTADRLYSGFDENGDLRVKLYSLGEHPTRGEVRRMGGFAQRDLVLGCPPECFVAENADKHELERTEAADVYRLAAVLHVLASGDHPLFHRDCDVADAVARLVNELEPEVEAPDTGDTSLDGLISTGISRDPSQRPSWEELKERLSLVCDGSGERKHTLTPADSLTLPSMSLRRLKGWFYPLSLVFVAAACVVATYLWSNRPPTTAAVLVTSQPEGIQFERVLDEQRSEQLGRTPLLLPEIHLGETVIVRPVYEDGEPGAEQTITPESLQLVEGCRTLHFSFE